MPELDAFMPAIFLNRPGKPALRMPYTEETTAGDLIEQIPIRYPTEFIPSTIQLLDEGKIVPSDRLVTSMANTKIVVRGEPIRLADTDAPFAIFLIRPGKPALRMPYTEETTAGDLIEQIPIRYPTEFIPSTIQLLDEGKIVPSDRLVTSMANTKIVVRGDPNPLTGTGAPFAHVLI